MNFFRTIYFEMVKGNFSFAILIIGIFQLIEMIKNRKYKLVFNGRRTVMIIDMSWFNDCPDNLESYLNKQGATLGENADKMQAILNSIYTCNKYGIVRKRTLKKMQHKFEKQFLEALEILNEGRDEEIK